MRQVPAVRVIAAAIEALPDSVVAYGSLAPNDEVALAFRNAGRIARLEVDIGSVVQKDEILATLDPIDFELRVREAAAAVRQARVQLGLPAVGDDDAVDPEATAAVRSARALLVEATTTRDRVRDLVERELRPPTDLDAAVATFGVAASRLQQALDDVRSLQAALAQRRIALDLATRALDETVLKAPFDAEVAERARRAPEFVAAGEVVLRLLDVDPLRLRLQVPERVALQIALGQAVAFTVDGVDGGFEGVVKRKSPRIDAATRTLLVEVEVPDPERRLRPGAFARAQIDVSAPTPRVVVPNDCVVSFAGVEKVFVVDGGVARERRVRTGRRLDGDRVEIETGLPAAARVIREPGDLADGSAITILGEPR